MIMIILNKNAVQIIDNVLYISNIDKYYNTNVYWLAGNKIIRPVLEISYDQIRRMVLQQITIPLTFKLARLHSGHETI